MSDSLAAEKGATHAQAVKAWKQLEAMDVPKTYRSWRRGAKARAPATS